MGSVDANTGDLLLGWDTDQFPTDVYLTTKMMLVILKYGGFTTGGLNFDAKVRRESFEPIDLFYAHVGGMDAFAKGLQDRRRDPGRRRVGADAQGSLRFLGLRRGGRDRGGPSRISPRWRSTCSARATPRRTPAAGRNCWRIS